MIFHRKIHPGQPGSKKYLEQYGDRFVCVRYTYDSDKGIRRKTVELVLEKGPWKPSKKFIPHNKIVFLRVRYGEVSLARTVNEAGGRWNREKGLWELPYEQAVLLGLENRVVE
jgi:hypothetical protein